MTADNRNLGRPTMGDHEDAERLERAYGLGLCFCCGAQLSECDCGGEGSDPSEQTANTSRLWKTSIVIWSDYEPRGLELEDLAREATSGGAYCSKQQTVEIADRDADEDWDGTEFFEVM